MHEYHDPVLLQACIEGSDIRTDGVYVDATFGGGGHSRAILEQLGERGRLIAFDRDADARANAPHDPRFTLVHADFRWMGNFLRYLGAVPVNGILADLGVSSHQFDTGDRGFSIRYDGPLDMRMDRRTKRTAAALIDTSGEADLARLLHRYGEVRDAHRVARAIKKAAPTTTGALAEAVRNLAPRQGESGFLAQVFQALRIAVNDELGSLESLLAQAPTLLAPGGRLVVISYHSLEDRLVKNAMRGSDTHGTELRDPRGHRQRPFDPLSSKAITPTEEEIQRNPRARSARLRIAVRR